MFSFHRLWRREHGLSSFDGVEKRKLSSFDGVEYTNSLHLMVAEKHKFSSFGGVGGAAVAAPPTPPNICEAPQALRRQRKGFK
jgi:hypothetical protein